MTILIYCPDGSAREAICHHLIDVASYRILIAETERLTIALAINNPVDVVILFDPTRLGAMKSILEFLTAKKSELRVRLLPTKYGALAPGWRRVLNALLKRREHRESKGPKIHPRFQWKPTS